MIEALMLETVYKSQLIELAATIGRVGRLERPDASATRRSMICGSTITVDIAVRDDQICDYAHVVKACALGQAAAAIVAKHVIGAPLSDLRPLAQTARAMLEANGPPPKGRWAEVAALEAVRPYSARHASTLLVFEALSEAAERAAANIADNHFKSTSL